MSQTGPWGHHKKWCQHCNGNTDHVTEMHGGVVELPSLLPPGLTRAQEDAAADRAAREVREEAARAGPSDVPAVGSRGWMASIMAQVFAECRALRDAGQAEYAHRDTNAFGNFDRVGESLGLAPERVLLVYLAKHFDGISAYAQGHTSQRESIDGRINDAIVYLCLLRGLVERRRAAVLEDAAATAVLGGAP